MSEKLQIEVEGVGAEQLKKQLFDIGREGTRVAQELRKEFRKSLVDQVRGGGPATNLAREAQIAMNSFRNAERQRAAINKEVEREIQANRRATAEDAKRAEKEVSAVRAAMAQQARAQRLQQVAEARVAAAQVVAAKRQVAAADARFVQEEIRRAAGLRRARVKEAQQAAKEEVAARRAAHAAEIGTNRGIGFVTGAIGVFGIRQAIADFIDFSDGMQNARNRLLLVSSGQEDAAKTMERLKQVSLDTRSSFDLVSRSYARTTNATRELGLSQSQNTSITKTLQSAIAVSGATNEEAHATLIQLTQAMASNRLSADEFRSVAEQLPAILDMISKATGRPRTELKKMGEEGKLTAAVLAYSFLAAEEEYAKAHAKMAPTIGQAWQNIKTEAGFALDKFNQVTGASKTLVDALMFLSTHMNEVSQVVATLAEMLGGLLVVQAGKAAIALGQLAVMHPWTALLVAAPAVFSIVRAYRDDLLDLLNIQKEIRVDGWDISVVNRRDKVMYNADGTVRRRGTTEQNRAHLEIESLVARDAKIREEMAAKQADADKLAALKAQMERDINGPGKKKRGRHITTFEEAVSSLEQDVAAGTLTNRGRSQMEAIMAVQDKLNGQLREGDKGYKHLTESQQEYVVALVDSKKKQEDTIATQRALFQQEMERIENLRKLRMEWRDFVADYRQDMQRLQNDIAIGIDTPSLFPKLSSATDFSRADAAVSAGVATGRFSQGEAQSARNQIELQRPNITSARRQFLEELEGIGKFKADLEGIFGPDGTIATGFSSAIAHSITFGTSFKKTIHDLGKTIQQEIIQTLIQGFIRMSILGIMGGGKATVPLPLTGSGKAVGGYTGDGPRTGVAGYHHYGEFVVNKQGTQQNRALLESINKGGSPPRATSSLNVTVMNQASGVQHEVQQIGPDEVYIIAKRAVAEHAPRHVAQSMNDLNSPMHKQLRRTTNTKIQR